MAADSGISPGCFSLGVGPERLHSALGGTDTVMSTKSQKMSRMQFLWLRWLARRCPWYIRLVGGKQADDIFRRVKEAEEGIHEH